MKHTKLVLQLIVVLVFASCTKSRRAELPEDMQSDILAISEFDGSYQANRESIEPASTNNSLRALEEMQNSRLSSEEVNVPARLKFMFAKLPISGLTNSKFEIKFLVDKKYVTAFKLVTDIGELTAIEKSLAMSSGEVELVRKSLRASKADAKIIAQSLTSAAAETALIKSGKKAGTLLVPLLKYEITGYGVISRTKNELKEETAVLKLTNTDFKDATHIQIKAKSDERLRIGGKVQDFDELFVESKMDNQVMTADELQARFKVGMKFIEGSAKVFTRLDTEAMHVYEMTTKDKLDANQLRLLKNQAGNQEILACSDDSVKDFIRSTDSECVLVLKADIPVTYKTVELAKENDDGSAQEGFSIKAVPRSASVGLVSIPKNTAAIKTDISGTLDPDSSVRIADLKGEFFYRRTFEAASNMFLGRTGTSGDMSIVEFELEDKRLVVRNKESLIKFIGQGPKDREEIMSFPVKYIRMNKVSANGAALIIPVAEVTTKEKAEYALIDWTQNTVPNASSPLSYYADGSCFFANSSQKVTDTDMRLEKDGVLNFSLSGSYSMQPRLDCIAMKDVNSAYWAGTYQFNYNIVERVSFKRHVNKDTDTQYTNNISSMAQEAFNFGTFGLADKVTETDALMNRDGSEKYMPIIHDFRNGKILKYYVGGLNTAATTPERKELIVEGTKQVIKEWNATLRYSFRGTSLERKGDYLQIIVDDGSVEPIGHLGDLDRNYIWFQELPAENGLLGVAQPAGNPRSGIIESANVIVYTGNTLDQTRRLIKMTAMSRQYEKAIEEMRKNAIEKAKAEKEMVSTKDVVAAAAASAATAGGKTNITGIDRIKARTSRIATDLKQAVKALQLDSRAAKAAIKNVKMRKSAQQMKKVLSKELFQELTKGEKVNFEVNQATFLKKITELSLNKRLLKNPHEFELAVNNAFMKFGGMDEASKEILQRRSEQLAMAVRFDENNKNRPGCFKYSRNDANDQALMLDPDPTKNLMLNFQKNVMSTLSHELGHAFGLLHNFTASTDKENYEFPGETTGRNYSSIMDYIADIDQNYFGPGPYDAHAVRAAYTGLVEVTDTGAAQLAAKGLKLVGSNLASIDDVVKSTGATSLVHFTKETLNSQGTIKHYAQCSDGEVGVKAMCAQFDVGGTAVEIVQNKISDYNRGYISRNYVYDKILFNWPQKMEVLTRNISLFQSIRGYLDQAVMTAIYGSGRTKEMTGAIRQDQTAAARLGYQFFHEVIRTPDASGVSVSDFQNRLYAVPYQFAGTEADSISGKCPKNEQGVPVCEDIKILEARSLYDKSLSREKMDTIGIGYDKIFAMQFLLQSSAAPTTDDSSVSNISYLDFEQWFMGIEDPSLSPTLNTMLQVMSNDLKSGFFAPNGTLVDINLPVEINKYLGDQTAIAAVIGLFEAKWRGFDPYAESFKVGSSFVKAAPKDRLNVTKMGQDREKSDTRVMFATQNSVASDVIVRVAARGDVLLGNQVALFKLMSDLYTADLVYMKAINPIIAAAIEKACELNAEGCAAMRSKTMDQHLAAFPELVIAKAAADRVAAKLVSKMRDLNAKEAIMTKDLDKPEAAMNFVRQVDVLRGQLTRQIGLVVEILMILEATPAAQINGTIQQIVQILQQVNQQNKELETIPLLSLSHVFMTGFVSEMKATLQDGGGEITGKTVAQNMMNGRKLQETQEKVLEVLANLSLYSSLVDPDTSIK